MKQKVGIITIHYVDNLGGVLLAYALQESVNQLGYDSCIINYDPTHIPSKASYLTRAIVRRIIRIPFYLLHFRIYFGLFLRYRGAALPPMHTHGSIGLRKKRFDSFRQHYVKLTERHYGTIESLKNSPPQCDAYICGSDQIWNPFICKTPDQAGNDPAYFLTFARKEKRVSYAPSIAIPSIPDEFRAEMREWILGIRFLSMREKHGAQLIKELTGRDAEIVLDPTLLLNSDQWNRIAIDPEIGSPYILCYFLGDGQEYRSFAKHLSIKTGYRLVIISQSIRDLEDKNVVSGSDAGPAEFLGLVKNASCVCTDSFHGTIFSITFRRPFYVFERPGSSGVASMSTRIYSILELLGLTSRLMKSDVLPQKALLDVDYSKADVLLQQNREKSLKYLSNALYQATSQ
jgi:Polysaccharide pyruvyl transferase